MTAPADSAPAAPRAPGPGTAGLAKVRVWDLPVRVVHWLLVADLVVLSITGILIGNPVLVPLRPMDWVTWVRAVHEVGAYVFIALLLARVLWMFMSPNRWSRWTEWIPISSARRRDIVPSLRFYLYLDREAPPVVGHNPLAGMTYTVLYAMFTVEIITGVALWGVQGEEWARTLTGWLLPLLSSPTIRFIHHLIMWLTWGFMVHHVYSAWLVDQVEGSGLVTSIFTGYKFLPRGRL